MSLRPFSHVDSVSRNLACFVVLFFSQAILTPIAVAQKSPDNVSTLTPAQLQKFGRAALIHLRDGHPELALRELESSSDLGSSPLFSEVDVFGAACAGLNRSLAQLDAQVRFDLLRKWSIIAESPAKIRNIVALVPTVVPPAEFARALGERPRNNAFPMSSIGPVRGIFSSAWSLVVAARDSGRLTRLATELGPLVENKVPGAELLMTLAKMADDRSDDSAVSELLSLRLGKLNNANSVAGEKLAGIDPENVVLALAALNHPVLRSQGEKLLAAMLTGIEGQSASQIRPFLRRAHATAFLLVQGNRSEADAEALLAPQFKFWVPVSGDLEKTNPLGFVDALWLSHEEHILHLAGSPLDSLMFRYPLKGDFSFQCDTQLGGQFATDGSLSYGGLNFLPHGSTGELRVLDVAGSEIAKRSSPFAHRPDVPAFNRLSISSSGESTTADVTHHPFWTDSKEAQSCPWLGLISVGECRPLFRNLKLAGKPVIPRFVKLSDQLRGWQALEYGTRVAATSMPEHDWKISQGMIEALPQAAIDSKKPLEQSLLSYKRPLLSGERIEYEFFYEPMVSEVSPAIGRIAFLLQPDGVRLHWLTDGNEEWTGLADDNALVEPLNRRGPRPLPFKSHDWNVVIVDRKDQLITVSLNDSVVYERAIDWNGDHSFGLYRHGTTVGVRVRNVVLTGDWPESIPKDFFDNPTAISDEPMHAPDRHALNTFFREDLIAANVFGVRRRALAMSVEDRFRYLSDSVLPGINHAGFRMTGIFTPTQPRPTVDEPNIDNAKLGAQVVSPVFDWLDAAKELGRLAECRQLIEQAPASDHEMQQRARMALILLISLEQDERAVDEWESFYQLLKQTPDDAENHWPEMLLACRGMYRFPENSSCSDLITELVVQRMLRWRRPDIIRWHTHLASFLWSVLLRRVKIMPRSQQAKNCEIGFLASVVELPATVLDFQIQNGEDTRIKPLKCQATTKTI